MAKYHITAKGDVAICNRKRKACPIAGKADHFNYGHKAYEVARVRAHQAKTRPRRFFEALGNIIFGIVGIALLIALVVGWLFLAVTTVWLMFEAFTSSFESGILLFLMAMPLWGGMLLILGLVFDS